MAKQPSKKYPPKTPDDRHKVILNFADQAHAKSFVSKHGFDFIQSLEPPKDQAASLVFYLTKDQIKIAKKACPDLEVHENVSAIGRKRQKEIGAGDRFKGGKVPPRSRNLAERGDY